MLLQLAVTAVAVYAGVIGLMYFTQRSLMYVTDRARIYPAAVGLAQAEEITLTASDGERLVTWHVPP